MAKLTCMIRMVIDEASDSYPCLVGADHQWSFWPTVECLHMGATLRNNTEDVQRRHRCPTHAEPLAQWLPAGCSQLQTAHTCVGSAQEGKNKGGQKNSHLWSTGSIPCHYTPHFNKVERGNYWFHVVRLSIGLCVHLWTESCPLCIFHNTSQIHFIFIHHIKQPQKVCCMYSFHHHHHHHHHHF